MKKHLTKTDFRIGNKVNYIIDKSVREGTIACLNHTTLTVNFKSFESHTIKYASIIPIELTEKWLVKYGAEKIITEGVAPIWEDIIEYEISGYDFAEDVYGNWYLSGVQFNMKRFKYVHELQNIIFSLTGLELHTGA